MATMVRYRLVPRGAFHVGERGVGMEETSVVIHSDTVFSALCVALRETGHALNPLLKRWPRAMTRGEAVDLAPGDWPPPFAVSSAFPYAGDVYFLPRPLLTLVGLSESEVPGLGKRLKKVRFVSEQVFAAIVNAQPLGPLLGSFIPEGASLQDGAVMAAVAEVEQLRRRFADPLSGATRFWSKDTASRVALDRKSTRSQVYGVGRVTFAAGCGLALLVAYNDESLRPSVERALRVLGDAGLGGERSSGHGQFSLEVAGAYQPPAVQVPNGYTLLSLYWPTRHEVAGGVLDAASYGLLMRRGWVSSPDGSNLRRRSVRMLSEGSVLRRLPQGALADVKPLDPFPATNVPHDVWRYGVALTVPCRDAEAKEASDVL